MLSSFPQITLKWAVSDIQVTAENLSSHRPFAKEMTVQDTSILFHVLKSTAANNSGPECIDKEQFLVSVV